jgi:hypothetical protein
MGETRKGGSDLESLTRLALPVFQRAEKENPRTGPGAKPTIPDWFMAVLIMIGVLKKKKSKSSQYRHLSAMRGNIAAWTGQKALPSRATFFRRFRRAKTLFRQAIKLQGELAITEKIVDPSIVTIDKSLLESRGDVWHKSDKSAGKKPAGVDAEAAWGYSEHHGWVYGYSYEVGVTSMADRTVFPLLASVDVASTSEMKSCPDKIANLPAGTVYVLMDSGCNQRSGDWAWGIRQDGLNKIRPLRHALGSSQPLAWRPWHDRRIFFDCGQDGSLAYARSES